MSRQSIDFIIVALVIVIPVCAALVYGVNHISKEVDTCAAKGGTMVRTLGGKVCAKLEVVK
jgi:hypothetical protein